MTTDVLKKIRSDVPLVHCIINEVVSADTAQLLKNIGASPVMAHSSKECHEITLHSDALLINTGILTEDKTKAIRQSLNAANKKNIPVVLDIVGYGLSEFRTKTIDGIIKKFKIDIIKGNKSEISILTSKTGKLKGIETDTYDKDVVQNAVSFAFKKNCIIVITGKTDIVTNGIKTANIKSGIPLMSSVIGTGCLLGAVMAAFCAAEKGFFDLVSNAVSFYGVIAEKTFKQDKAISPYKFKINFIDNFYKFDTMNSVNKNYAAKK